jgi:hypothetical protein
LCVPGWRDAEAAGSIIGMLTPRRSLGPGLLLSIEAAFMLAAGCARAPAPEGPSAEVVTLAPPFVELMQLTGPAPLGGDMVEGSAGDWLFNSAWRL